MTSFEEAREVGAVNAALMVVRQLVTGMPDGVERVRRLQARARYCQVLASRMKLGAAQSHRVALAAWLSGLEGRDDIARQLAIEHKLDTVLFPAPESADEIRIEAEILAVVRGYETLRATLPSQDLDPSHAGKLLGKALPRNDPETRHLVKLFVGVLRDEAFLSGAAAAAGRLLVVDPAEAVAPVLSPPLVSEGYEVRVAPNAETARQMLADFRPDLVLVEADLAVVNGITLCSEIKANAATAGIPVLVLSKSRGRKLVGDCLKAGAEEVIKRPVDLEMLFLRLSRLVKPAAAVPADTGAAGVTGTLKEMAFTDIIQVVTAGARSLEITLKHEDETGRIYIKDGEIIHAEVNDEQGETAFYRIMGWTEGTFTTRRREEFDQRSIQASVMGLLMEGARRSDEA